MTAAGRRTLASVTAVLTLVLPGSVVNALPAAAEPLTVGTVTVVDDRIDVSDGFGILAVDIELSDPEGIPDEIAHNIMGDATVLALEPVEDSRPWDDQSPDDPPAFPTVIAIDIMRRISGTSTDGVWRASVEVSPYFTGTYLVTRAVISTNTGFNEVDVSDRGATVEIGDPAAPPWRVSQATLPMKVVTGRETWTARWRVTDRLTGAPIAAFMEWTTDLSIDVERRPQARTRTVAGRADGNGYFTSPFVYTLGPEFDQSIAWGRARANRGSRGFSLESNGCATPLVKWQANERVATSGRTVTITGNAFPAPSLYIAANPSIHFQVLIGRTWRTVTSAVVRSNGRYTLVWTAPAAGGYYVRAYKPGGSEGVCFASIGTVLAAVGVTVS
jgi:hypothetical protein